MNRKYPSYRMWKPALMIAVITIVAVFGLMAGTQHVLAQSVGVIDDGGSNDPNGDGQNDLTRFTRDDSTAGELTISWSWDEPSAIKGGNESNACALFDTNGDSNIDIAICVQAESVNDQIVLSSGYPRILECSSNPSRSDRCTQPTLIAAAPSYISTSIAEVDNDPFPPTGQTAGTPGGAGDDYPTDVVATLTITRDDGSGSDPLLGGQLVNVCSYPAAGNDGNNNPFDCVVTPGAGFLQIVKDAGGDAVTDFTFTISPGSTTGETSFTITGDGETELIPVSPGSFSVLEAVPAQWQLDDVACTTESGGSTGTDSTTFPATGPTNAGATGVAVSALQTTVCTFTDSIAFVPEPAISVSKTVVKVTDEDGVTVDDVAPFAVDEAGDVITYDIVVRNIGNVTLTGVNVDDDLTGTVDAVCGTGTLAPGAECTVTVSYTVLQTDINNNGPTTDGDIDNIATGDSVESLPATDDAAVPVVYNAQLQVTKTVVKVTDEDGVTVDDVAPFAVDEAGDVITYDIVVKNIGNVTLTGVNVDDDLTGTVDAVCGTGTLAPGAECTVTVSYTVTQADINNNGPTTDGDIDNTATADSAETDPVTDSEQVPVVYNAQLQVTKTVVKVTDEDGVTVDDVAPFAVDEAGDVITYDIVVRNIGNVTLTGVNVDDDLTGTVDAVCGTGTLAPGAECTVTVSYTVLQSDLNDNGGGDGDIDNIATASSNEVAPQSDDEQLPIIRTPIYSIVKTITAAGDGQIDTAGEVIEYQIVVSNDGNVDLTGVSVADPLLEGTNGTLSTATESINANGVLEVGETWTYTGTYTVQQPDLDGNGIDANGVADNDGDIDNTATVSSEELPDESDSAEQPLSGTANYSIVKTITAAGDGQIDTAGEVIEYQIVVENSGNISLNGVSVSDPLLAGTLTGPTESINANGVLEVGETWTYTGTYTVQQPDLDGNGIDANGVADNDGDIDNTATVSSEQLPDESDSARQPIIRTANYSIVKTITAAGDGQIDTAGEVIEYQIVVSNDGNVELTAVSVADPLLEGANGTLSTPTESINTNGVLEVGETWTYTGTYTVQQSDLNDNGGGDGDIDNTATVSSEELPDESDSATQPIVRNAAYSIDKSVAGADSAGDGTINNAGEVIEYVITVINDGNVDLTGVNVSDPLLAGTLTGPTESINANGVLEVGETWTYTGTYTVQQSDLNDNGGGDGDIDNTATVSSEELPDESDSATQPIVRNAAYSIDKSVAGADSAGDGIINNAGEVIEYVITVINDGNVDLAGVSVSDPLLAGTLSGPVESRNTDSVLEVGETWTYTGTYTVQQSDLNDNGGGDGDIDNTATVSSEELPDESDSATQPVVQNPALAINKSPDSQTVMLGAQATFTIEVANTGNVTLFNVTVNDELAPECEATFATLPVGAVESYTCTMTVTDDVTNVATTSGTGPQEQPTEDDDSAVVDALPVIQVNKSAATPVVAEPGGTVSYLVEVVNNSGASDPVTINSLTDDKFGDLTLADNTTCVLPQTVQPGATYSCTFDGNVSGTAADEHINLVTAVAQDDEGNTTEASDSATVDIVDQPLGAIGDRVTLDENGNGLQDDGEPGVQGVTVYLTQVDGEGTPIGEVRTTTTDADGFYLFDNLPEGTYFVSFDSPDGLGFTQANQGDNEALDSDAQAPKLTLAVNTDANTVVAGDAVTYTIVLFNDSVVDATNVEVRLVVPLLATIDLSGSPDWVCAGGETEAGTSCVYTVGNLAAGASMQIPVRFDTDPDAESGTELVVVVTAEEETTAIAPPIFLPADTQNLDQDAGLLQVTTGASATSPSTPIVAPPTSLDPAEQPSDRPNQTNDLYLPFIGVKSLGQSTEGQSSVNASSLQASTGVDQGGMELTKYLPFVGTQS